MELVSLTEASPSVNKNRTVDTFPFRHALNMGELSGTARTGLKLNCHPVGVENKLASIPYFIPTLVNHQDGKNVKDETISTLLPVLELA